MLSRQIIRPLVIFAITFLSVIPQWLMADTIRVAVASNFLPTLEVLVAEFEKTSSHTVSLSSASTGKLFAQITNGAPFDLFLAADSERPDLIARQNADGQPAKTYSYGRLVLVVADGINANNNPASDTPCVDALLSSSVKRIAIANPMTAPYGSAAKETLELLGLWDQVKSKMVMGENIAQTLHFVDSQNAQAGFVAKSQLFKHDIKARCEWDVPEQYHEKIEQKMVRLPAAKNTAAVSAFWDFMSSDVAREIIRTYGYDLPAVDR